VFYTVMTNLDKRTQWKTDDQQMMEQAGLIDTTQSQRRFAKPRWLYSTSCS
jgi:hypothetical protein